MSDAIRWHLEQMFKLEKQMDSYERVKEVRMVPRFPGAGIPTLGPNMTEMQGDHAVTQEELSIAPLQNHAKVSQLSGRLAHMGGCYHCDHGNKPCICPGQPAVDRAVHNSLPPMDDVGEDVTSMQDPKDPDFMYSDVEQLLDERNKTHGSFHLNSKYGQMLREMFRGSPGWHLATDRTREVLDYCAGKLSRILSGNPEEKQHWEDLAGFARLQYSKKQRQTEGA